MKHKLLSREVHKMGLHERRWTEDNIRTKTLTTKVTLSSGYTTVVSAPISGQLRHIVNVVVGPIVAGSGLANFGFVGVRASGQTGSEAEKHVFAHGTNNVAATWGGDELKDQVVELRLGETLVGRGAVSGIDDASALWWEE
jgi:hypothetical protein